MPGSRRLAVAAALRPYCLRKQATQLSLATAALCRFRLICRFVTGKRRSCSLNANAFAGRWQELLVPGDEHESMKIDHMPEGSGAFLSPTAAAQPRTPVRVEGARRERPAVLVDLG